MIALDRISRVFPRPDAPPFAALDGVDLRVGAGEIVALWGRSGCGKSTLLNMVSGIDRPTDGAITVAGSDLGALGSDRLTAWRGRTVGVVFQFFQLLPTLTVLDNVILPMELVGAVPSAARVDRARTLLARVGIADQADKRPATLSGGQRQRAAIARALANRPAVLVADEPTGNLDEQASAAIYDLISGLASEGTTVLVATHDAELAARAGRIVRLRDGRVDAAGEGA